MLIIDGLTQQHSFTKAEMHIADFIMENSELITTSSIDEVALLTFSSPSTIVRFCKKLGLSGFSDFKIELTKELAGLQSSTARVEQNIPLTGQENDEEIYDIFSDLYIQSIKRCYLSIDQINIRKTALLIHQASVVNIYGRSDSLIAAQSLHQKLLRLGTCSILETMEGFQQARAYEKIDNQVAIVFSNFASSRKVKSIINDLHYHDIPFVLITSNEKSLLLNLAKTSIVFSSSETYSKMGSFASTLSMNYIADCIYGCLFNMDYEENIEKLAKYTTRVEYRNEQFNN